jgi:hypothetical protein
MLVPPGRYTVKVSAAGQEQSQALEVQKDPASTGTEDDIRAQTELWTSVRSDLEATVDLIHTIESARAQVAVVKTITSDAAVRSAADTLEQRLVAVEEPLTQLRITGRGQDLIRYPARLGEKLVYLANDVVSSDNAPTQSQRDVAAGLKAQLQAARAAIEQVVARDIAGFNALLRSKGLEGVVAKP